jgi:hypothetical protein
MWVVAVITVAGEVFDRVPCCLQPHATSNCLQRGLFGQSIPAVVHDGVHRGQQGAVLTQEAHLQQRSPGWPMQVLLLLLLLLGQVLGSVWGCLQGSKTLICL